MIATRFEEDKMTISQLTASALAAFRAQSQSTLIAFRGKTETGRSVGDTGPSSIAALVKSTLAK